MLLKAVLVKLTEAVVPGFIVVIDCISPANAAPLPPPPPPPPLLLLLELLDEEELPPVTDTVTALDLVVVTDEDVPEAVTVLTQLEEPCDMLHVRVASALLEREPALLEAESPDASVQPPEPLHTSVTLPRSPPARTAASTVKVLPSATDEDDEETVIDFITITLIFVLVTEVSALLSICTD